MKKLVLALAGVLVVALAVAIAKELSSEAAAVLVGIVCGVGASIPASTVLLWVISRQDRIEHTSLNPHPQVPPPGKTVNIYGPCIIGEGATILQLGAPQPWRPTEWQAPQVTRPDVLLLPGGERDA